MNDELRGLYQEVIIDHGRRPRNHHALPQPCCQAHGDNPLCGDELTVYVALDATGKQIEALSFEGQGCALSMASASLLTESLQCKSVVEAQALIEQFHTLITCDETPTEQTLSALGKLRILSGVREYPMRVKCVTLAWHTLTAALDNQSEIVSTE